jgi:hypothetical protein
LTPEQRPGTVRKPTAEKRSKSKQNNTSVLKILKNLILKYTGKFPDVVEQTLFILDSSISSELFSLEVQ